MFAHDKISHLQKQQMFLVSQLFRTSACNKPAFWHRLYARHEHLLHQASQGLAHSTTNLGYPTAKPTKVSWPDESCSINLHGNKHGIGYQTMPMPYANAGRSAGISKVSPRFPR